MSSVDDAVREVGEFLNNSNIKGIAVKKVQKKAQPHIFDPDREDLTTTYMEIVDTQSNDGTINPSVINAANEVAQKHNVEVKVRHSDGDIFNPQKKIA